MTLDFKVICIFWDFFYNLHIIDNHCGEYVHTRSKNERGIRVLSHSQVLSMCDLDLWPQGHISYLKPLFYSTHHDQSLCNLGAMMYLKSLMHVYPLLKKKKKKKNPWFCGQITLEVITMVTIPHNFTITIIYTMLPLNINWINSNMTRCCGFA